MIPRWLREFYGGTPATFFSSRSVHECVERLRCRVRGSLVTSFDLDCIVGHVQRDAVRLRHVRPFVSNAFKPIFVGRFSDEKAGALLTGRFKTMLFPRIFMAVWFGFVAFWTLLATALAILFQFVPKADDADLRMVWIFPPAGIAFGLLGLAFFWFASHLARGDIEHLSRVIEESLGTHDDKQPGSKLHDAG